MPERGRRTAGEARSRRPRTLVVAQRGTLACRVCGVQVPDPGDHPDRWRVEAWDAPPGGHGILRKWSVAVCVDCRALTGRASELADQWNVCHRRALAAIALGEVSGVDNPEVLHAASMRIPDLTWLSRMCEARAAGASSAASVPWGHLDDGDLAAARRALIDVCRARLAGRDPFTTPPPGLGVDLDGIDAGCLVCGLDRDRRWTAWEGSRRMLGLAGSRHARGSLCVACHKARLGAAWPHEAVEACLRSALPRPVAWEVEAALHPVANFVFAARVLVARERGTRQPDPSQMRFGWVDLEGPVTRVPISPLEQLRAEIDW